MVCVPRRLRARRWRFHALFGLACLALLAAAGGPASAQTSGCGRCGDSSIRIGPFSFPNPFASPAPASSGDPVRRAYEQRGSATDGAQSRKSSGHGSAAKGGAIGGSMYVCVRTCDGSFFPLPYTGASGAVLEDVCRTLCPNADVALFTMPFGGTIDQGASWKGASYVSQPYALKFQQSYEAACSCQRPGQSWADALAAAEAKYGRRSHEIVVTAKVSDEMARPKPDPAAKLAAAKGGLPLGAADVLDPGLDINGVDTKLKAATEAVSRETSGIEEQRGKGATHFGLAHGDVVEEDDPDGGRRKVRIVAPLF